MYGERRSHARTFTNAEATLVWTLQGRPVENRGFIKDYSRSGLRIQLDRPVVIKSPVTVTVNGHDLHGVVRYCTQIQRVYMVGVEFQAAAAPIS